MTSDVAFPGLPAGWLALSGAIALLLSKKKNKLLRKKARRNVVLSYEIKIKGYKINMSNELEKYYNKFCEEKRLTRRHGNVEYITSMKYIHKYLKDKNAKILDVGAGTGRYSVQLATEGYDVTAVELVKYNLGILKSKGSSVKAYQGTALNLSRFEEETFDMTLVFRTDVSFIYV